jgi:hypothetical protein
MPKQQILQQRLKDLVSMCDINPGDKAKYFTSPVVILGNPIA